MLEVKLTLSWNYKGQKGKETVFHTAVGSFITSMRDWAPAFRAMATEVLEPAVDEQFATHGHGTWAELMPETIKRKGSSEPLIETRRLFGSFKRGGADHVEDVTRQSLRWGSNVPYGLFHQTGTLAGFQSTSKAPGLPGVPMRKIFALTSTQKAAMRSILVARLATIARREGFAAAKGSITDPLAARKSGKDLLDL